MGITIVWRGGRPFKNPPSATASKAKDSEVILIDDDNDESTQTPEDEFDAEEAEFDEEEPYDKVVQSETIRLDSPVLHLGVPDISLELNGSTDYSIPSILRDKLVVVIACAEGSVRLLNMNLVPTRNPEKNDIVEKFIIEAQQSPIAVCTGLAVTWTAQEQINAPHGDGASTPEWSLLVATHSARAGGVLAVYQVHLQDDGADVRSGEAVTLLQEEYLQKHITKTTFNSAVYPARHHSQLLIAVAGAVMIYEPFPRKRYPQQTSTQGSWLTSFYPPFEASALGRRSEVLDASWACNGQCVMVLLRDGQWGLWDIEGVAPDASGPSKRGSFKAFTSNSGVSGGGVTRFAVTGYVGENQNSRGGKLDLSDSHNTAKDAKRLTPMTPNTRKVKQQALFTAPAPSSKVTGLPKGGIDIASVPAAKAGTRPDETVIMWYENSLYSIPSLLSYWQRIVNGSSNSDSLSCIEAFSAYNESITNVSQGPSRGQQPSISSLQRDVLVSAEYKLLTLCPVRTAPQSEGPVKRLFAEQASYDQRRSITAGMMDLDEEDVIRFDQDMLSKGQLDIGGLDRMLSGMNGANDSVLSARAGGNGAGLYGDLSQSRTRRVGFAAGF